MKKTEGLGEEEEEIWRWKKGQKKKETDREARRRQDNKRRGEFRGEGKGNRGIGEEEEVWRRAMERG